MSSINNTKLNFAEYLFSFFLVIQASSVWAVSINPEFYLFPLTTLSCIYLWFRSKKYFHAGYSMNKLSWMIMILSIVYLLLTWGKGISNIIISIFIIGIPLLIDYFSLCFKKGRIYDLFYKIEYIVYLLSICSLIIWIIGPILGWVDVNCEMRNCHWGSDRSYKGYFYLLFEAQQEDGTFLSTSILRNSSVFAEAPMFNLWLMISIIVELFLREKIIRKRLIIFVISILTAFSTTGILFLIICFILRLYNKNVFKSSKHIKLLNYLFLFVGIIGSYYLISSVLTLKSSSGSYETRMGDFESAIMYLAHNSFLGTGYGDGTNMVDLIGTKGFSNGFFAVLITGGIYISSIVFIPMIIALFKGISTGNKTLISLVVCFLYIFITVLCSTHCWIAVCVAFFYVSVMSKINIQKIL